LLCLHALAIPFGNGWRSRGSAKTGLTVLTTALHRIANHSRWQLRMIAIRADTY
jgi:hypothetical protein